MNLLGIVQWHWGVLYQRQEQQHDKGGGRALRQPHEISFIMLHLNQSST